MSLLFLLPDDRNACWEIRLERDTLRRTAVTSEHTHVGVINSVREQRTCLPFHPRRFLLQPERTPSVTVCGGVPVIHHLQTADQLSATPWSRKHNVRPHPEQRWPPHRHFLLLCESESDTSGDIILNDRGEEPITSRTQPSIMMFPPLFSN